MFKKKFSNFSLYLLFLVNFAYAIKNGFNWLFYISAGLTAITLIFDIVEVIKRHGE